MVNPIVSTQVFQTQAPTPSTLQKMGAFISQGATSLADGESALLTQLSDLTSILNGVLAVTGIVQTTGTATATATAPHGIPNGETVEVVISGASPVAYNGLHAATSTGASTFTFPIASGTTSPATGTIKWTLEDVGELLSMATTFFAQGSSQAAYVLELGIGDAADGVAALAAYLTANPNSDYTSGAEGFFYAYLVPRNWADETTFAALVADYQAPTAMTYFFVPITLDNYTNFTALDKSVFSLIQAAGAPSTEFTLAAPFYAWLNNRPSATNKVPPFAFTFLYGVTPWPTKGNSAQLATLLAAGVNYVGTGAQGGISTAILRNGTMMDKRGASYWYSIDWIQINVQLNISNAVINGSNNKVNPLYYNQPGIDRLQKVGAQTFSNAVTFGLAVGTVIQTGLDGPAFSDQLNSGAYNGKLVINAVPFVPYNLENPGDYKIGEYDGFTGVYVDQNGFIHILFNITVTDFVAQ